MEMELAEEDVSILFKVASSFFHLKPEQASARVTKSLEDLETAMEILQTEAGACKEKMDDLKSTLYAKFGQAINLERE